MNDGFLQSLSLSNTDRAKLKQLAAQTPQGLLDMIRASPEAFEQYLGADKIGGLLQELELMTAGNEKAASPAPDTWQRGMGAILERPAPPLKQPGTDIEERDRLFTELQTLRQQDTPSPENGARIRQLENRLNALLEAAS